MSRLRLIAGILLLVLGAAAVAMSARVLSTFLLEIVVQTIDSDPGREIPPYEFSWGMMEWGNMARDFSMVAAGLMLIGLGQFLVIPGAVVHGGSGLQRSTLVGAAVMTLVAAASYFLVPFSAMRTFGMLASSGAPDPGFLGEELAVLPGRVFVGCLAAAQLLFVAAALMGARSGDDAPAERPAGKLLLVRAACTCVLLFGLAILFVRLVPVRMIAEFPGTGGAADPAKLAGLISQALRTMLFATPLLVISGVLVLIASLLPKRRSDAG